MKVLFAGETWFIHSIHQKGFDSFTTSEYGEGQKWLQSALEDSGVEVVHMPNHVAPSSFPSTLSELRQYDVIILSDIGSNSLLLHPKTLKDSLTTPNRLMLIDQFVRDGGGFLMCGGWMSFQGIDGKAKYQGSPVETLLPVSLLESDDRAEIPQGFAPRIVRPGHRIFAGIPENFPRFLFYNRLKPKDSATVLAQYENDPVIAIWEYGKGRSCAFAMDIAPHGATKEFLEWRYFGQFWFQLVSWLAERKQ